MVVLFTYLNKYYIWRGGGSVFFSFSQPSKYIRQIIKINLPHSVQPDRDVLTTRAQFFPNTLFVYGCFITCETGKILNCYAI